MKGRGRGQKRRFSREIVTHLGPVLIVYASKWHAATTCSVNQNGHGLSWTIIDVRFLNQNNVDLSEFILSLYYGSFVYETTLCISKKNSV